MFPASEIHQQPPHERSKEFASPYRAWWLRGWVILILAAMVLGCTTGHPSTMAKPDLTDQAFMELLSQRSFQFFWDQADPDTGLIPDRYPTPSFASIAAVGFGLTAYPIGAERGYVTRAQASQRVLKTLRFLVQAPQGPDPQGMTGYKGFYYHFLDMKTGKRFQQVELSTIDTALLVAGAVSCKAYFKGTGAEETEIRQLVDQLYGNVDWTWAMARPNRVALGWSPEGGFLPHDWIGYTEAMVLLTLGLGSPTHPLPAEAWPTFTSTNPWVTFYGQSYVSFGPLFGHQFSHAWIDYRNIRDDYMRVKGIDYAENTRRATYAQRAYAMANPGHWKGYGSDIWGLSACDGPADITLTVDGQVRKFLTYAARGVDPIHPLDDGTISPDAAAGSLPFAPEIALPALQAMRLRFGQDLFSTYGFLNAFNETFPPGQRLQHGKMVPGLGWVDTDYLGIEVGLILVMLENHRTGMIWNLMKTDPQVVRGLQRAGFSGGWLNALPPLQPRP